MEIVVAKMVPERKFPDPAQPVDAKNTLCSHCPSSLPDRNVILHDIKPAQENIAGAAVNAEPVTCLKLMICDTGRSGVLVHN
ncbi:MAG: hypothetical protein MZV70_05645 [Desulfobacterales bacterium]|nr:hypothetical protein [Desulfobacterales bacterium]